jgi:hypothetical protein
VPASSTGKVRRRLLPRWRFFTWVILAFNLIMLIWVVIGASTGKSCKGLTGDALTNCQAGQIGTGIGVGLIILLWALGDIILGTMWHQATDPAVPRLRQQRPQTRHAVPGLRVRLPADSRGFSGRLGPSEGRLNLPEMTDR